ncbi:MAG: hypothetical protein MAG451_02891 [Anaerolineales bacterium]|nr:hypothetical protein [Anaerolineales bacterium]
MSVGPCGIVCTICRYFIRGLCSGCMRGDVCSPERALLSPCPILQCAVARTIPYCARDCEDFPCALFEQRFPRCWYQATSRRPGVAQLDEWCSSDLPMQGITSESQQPGREGLRIFCLGPFRVYLGSEEITDDDWGQGKGPTHKIKAMFAYLLCQKGRGARKETLIDLLWPEQVDYDQASARFHQALHYLRRALEPDLTSRAASSYIRYERGRYCFDPLKPYWIDADVFESYCRRARECSRYGDPEAAMLYWDMALDVYGGDFMADIPIDYTQNRLHDWCLPRRHRLGELYLAALLEIARYHRNIHEYGSGVRYARAALDVEPASEPAHRLAIQCLIENGQLDSAIHQYRVCEAELVQYENRTPSEETRFLYEQLV